MPWLVACSIGYGFVAHVAATLVVQPKLMKRKLSAKFEHLLKYILNSRTHKKRHHEAILLIWSLSAGHSVLYIQGLMSCATLWEASAKIERICTADDDGLFRCFEENGGQSVIRAAGNIKYIFATREACEKAVLEFPKR